MSISRTEFEDHTHSKWKTRSSSHMPLVPTIRLLSLVIEKRNLWVTQPEWVLNVKVIIFYVEPIIHIL